MMSIKDRLPKDIDYYQINDIKLEPITLDLSIGFINPISPDDFFSINFKNLAYFSVSKTPNDIDGIFQIGCCELFHCKDPHSLSELVKCGLVIYERFGESYYLHIEGDVCIDVVSEELIIDNIAEYLSEKVKDIDSNDEEDDNELP